MTTTQAELESLPQTGPVPAYDVLAFLREAVATASAGIPGQVIVAVPSVVQGWDPSPPAAAAPIPAERVDAIMDWLRGDSLDWDAVERARSEAWR